MNVQKDTWHKYQHSGLEKLLHISPQGIIWLHFLEQNPSIFIGIILQFVARGQVNNLSTFATVNTWRDHTTNH